MYDVDVNKLNRIFTYTNHLLNDTHVLFEQIKQDKSPSTIPLLAAQRILLIYFEVFTDVANILIDGFVMRDPGGYEDMVDILDDEQVITADTSNLLRQLVQFYRQSVKNYIDFDLDDTASLFLKLYPSLHSFSEEVLAYVHKEL